MKRTHFLCVQICSNKKIIGVAYHIYNIIKSLVVLEERHQTEEGKGAGTTYQLYFELFYYIWSKIPGFGTTSHLGIGQNSQRCFESVV